MWIGEIEAIIEGGGRIVVRFPDSSTKEYGLSRGRRMLEKPKVGMAVAHTPEGNLQFFASVDEAQHRLSLGAP
jgi:hypothetical protein